MEETKLVLNLKNIRKVAFAAGVGFTVGKYVGGWVNAAMDGVTSGVLKSLAKHENETAQHVCERNNIEYEESDKKKQESDKVEMGFHA